MIKYTFKDDEILTIKSADKADPNKIGQALEAITVKAGGHLTPTSIVEAARDRKSVLHRHFEWDDKVAAESFRLDQARSLVRSIHVESADAETGTARAFLSVRTKEGTSYRALGEILASGDLQARVLAQAERDLLAFENRYKALEDICSLIREARERLSARRINNESRAQA